MLIHALLRRKSDGSRAFVNILTPRTRTCSGRMVFFNDVSLAVKIFPKPNDEPRRVSGLCFSDDYRTMHHPEYDSIIVVPCLLQDNIIYTCWALHGFCEFETLLEVFEPYWQSKARTKDERVEMQCFDRLYLWDVRTQDTCDMAYVVGIHRWVFAPRLVYFLGLDAQGNQYRGRVVLKGALQRNEKDDERVSYPEMHVDDMLVPGPVTLRRVDSRSYMLEHTHFLQFARVEFASVPFSDETDTVGRCRAAENKQRAAASSEHIAKVNELSYEATRRHDAIFRGMCR